jgi:hypothetical protein
MASHNRFYFLGRDNRIRRACNVECEDETQALPRAAELKHIHGMEVWQQARKIGEIPPALSAAAREEQPT